MSTSATGQIGFGAAALPRQDTRTRRRISPEAGYALEKLGHAIEYLTDEFMVQQNLPAIERRARLQAIDLLMSLNRQVYFSCPEVPTLRERITALFRR